MILATLIPTIITGVFKLIKRGAEVAEKKTEANPKATNGAVITIIVTAVCLYAESIGIEVTPEIQEQVVAVVAGAGALYTAWRASR